MSSVSLNVGILGHVDGGKTALAKALSEIGSTAAFDKHAKSPNLRANTIDLGYSSMRIGNFIIALIDCPGHASLIRHVLAASAVFDMAIVVVNAIKGIEQQTAEHLLIVSLLCPEHVIIAITKVDLVDQLRIRKLSSALKKAISKLRISDSAPIVPISLLEEHQISAVKAMREVLESNVYIPKREIDAKFIMYVDHCFPVKGKGTVMTGTVVSGTCRVGTEVEIPELDGRRKIRSMEQWKRPVSSALAGERAALLLQNLSAPNLDRCVIFESGALSSTKCLLLNVRPISYFSGTVHECSKLQLSFGFDLVGATFRFLKGDGNLQLRDIANDGAEFEWINELNEDVQLAIAQLDRHIFTRKNAFYVASRLESATERSHCRFAFSGTVHGLLENDAQIRYFRRKRKTGFVERVESEHSVICTDMFTRESNIQLYSGMRVQFSTGEIGKIEGSFGKSGKIRVNVSEALESTTIQACARSKAVQVVLNMLKFVDGEIRSC